MQKIQTCGGITICYWIISGFSSVQFSCSVVSDYLWPHESQHARPPCPSPTPGVHPESMDYWKLKRACSSSLREGNGTPLQYSCLENTMGGRAWWAAVHGVAKSQTWLSNFTFTFHFHALEKAMATHSSVLAWRVPGTAEPGGLPSMGSHRVRHDWGDLAAAAAAVLPLFLHDNVNLHTTTDWLLHSLLENYCLS